MTSTFSLDLVRRSLEEDGFFNLQDSTVGERVSDMEPGYLLVEYAFKNGSLIIADARLAFEFKKGYTIVDIFFFDKLLLPKKIMLFYYLDKLVNKIDKMQFEEIRVNFRFETPAKDVDEA
ncbi:hypothetical protein F5Y16DRAFT_401013 [Xylariaceae sp. FL0255]|nr:hypothetical protein F5Y16DRAFT_401013 [Xylariaceae sp. FL0255]